MAVEQRKRGSLGWKPRKMIMLTQYFLLDVHSWVSALRNFRGTGQQLGISLYRCTLNLPLFYRRPKSLPSWRIFTAKRGERSYLKEDSYAGRALYPTNHCLCSSNSLSQIPGLRPRCTADKGFLDFSIHIVRLASVWGSP